MTCEHAQEIIALAVFGELPDESRPQLELHLSQCEACRQELQAVEALAKAMSLLPAEEPTANLMARTRMKLADALDAMPNAGWLLRFCQGFTQGMGKLRAAPVAASALLLAGLGAGAYGGYRLGAHEHQVSEADFLQHAMTSATAAEQIASVSQIIPQPQSGTVEVVFNRLEPDTIEGSPNDPQIRHLLLLGTQNRLNAGVRDDSVGLLAEACRAGNVCDDEPTRNALMVSLLYDKSSTVRMKALKGLQPYVADDMRVRDSVLEALMKDPEARIRTEAIGLLTPVEADSSVRQVLHTVVDQDDNPEIRTASQQILDNVPQVQ
jgi:hypothetical protein